MNDTTIRFACRTDVGKLRDYQEDSFLSYDPDNDAEALQRQGRLYIVADGMGGHAAGEVASGIAVQTIVERYRTDPGTDVTESLVQAIAAANAAIHRQAQSGANSGMGTTVVCVVLRDRELYVAHVGDSRAYLMRADELRQLTEDHTVVNELVRGGQMTAEQAAESPRKHILSRALGPTPTVTADVQGPISLQPDDVIMLCTDGISQQVPDQQIEQAVRLALKDPQAAADALVEHANASGGRDNATAVVLRVDQAVPTTESVPPPLSKQAVLAAGTAPPPPPKQAVPPLAAPGKRRSWIIASLMVAAGLCLGCGLGTLMRDPVFKLFTTPTPVPPTQTPAVYITLVVITATPTETPTASPTPSSTPTPTDTPIPTATPTFTPMPTATFTPSPTASATPIATATSTPSPVTTTVTPSPTASATPSPVRSETPAATPTATTSS